MLEALIQHHHLAQMRDLFLKRGADRGLNCFRELRLAFDFRELGLKLIEGKARLARWKKAEDGHESFGTIVVLNFRVSGAEAYNIEDFV